MALAFKLPPTFSTNAHTTVHDQRPDDVLSGHAEQRACCSIIFDALESWNEHAQLPLDRFDITALNANWRLLAVDSLMRIGLVDRH